MSPEMSAELTENEDVVEWHCDHCEEDILIVIHIPRPTFSTYVKKYLEEEDDVATSD